LPKTFTTMLYAFYKESDSFIKVGGRRSSPLPSKNFLWSSLTVN
jgi:hypothetical protein